MKLLKMLILSMFLVTTLVQCQEKIAPIERNPILALAGVGISFSGLYYTVKNTYALYKKIRKILEDYANKQDTTTDVRALPLSIFRLASAIGVLDLGNRLITLCEKIK